MLFGKKRKEQIYEIILGTKVAKFVYGTFSKREEAEKELERIKKCKDKETFIDRKWLLIKKDEIIFAYIKKN